MNTLSKISSLLALSVSLSLLFGARCGRGELENQEEWVLLTFLDVANQKTSLREGFEPNNDFNSASCQSRDLLISYVYPAEDLDYYKMSLRSGAFKLYLINHTSLGSERNFGFQVYDEQKNLIYDLNNRSFDSTNANIQVNRNLTQSECQISSCPSLEKYRYIEFSPSITSFYLKFYSLEPSKYNEDSQQPNYITIAAKDSLEITSRGYVADFFLKGDFAECK